MSEPVSPSPSAFVSRGFRNRLLATAQVLLSLLGIAVAPHPAAAASFADPDTGFGNQGTIQLTTGGDIFAAVGNVTGDIYAIDYLPGASGPTRQLIRFSPSGQKDEAFGFNISIPAAPADTGMSNAVYSFAVDERAGGRVYVFFVEWAKSNGVLDRTSAAEAYTFGGVLDTTFGHGTGMATVASAFPTGISVLPNGEILIAGDYTDPSIYGFSIWSAKLRYDGSFDDSYGTGGVSRVSVPSTYSGLYTRSITYDQWGGGAYVVGGVVTSPPGSLPSTAIGLVARLTSDGQLDPAFGQSGVATVLPGGNGTETVVEQLGVAADGSVVALGDYEPSGSHGGATDAFLAKFSAAGLIDASYGTEGVVTAPLPHMLTTMPSWSLQGDGKVLLADQSFLSDGLPPTFGLPYITRWIGSPDLANPSPPVNLAVLPSTILVGSQATLSWTSTNVTACTASGTWSGAEPTSGELTVSPATVGTETYTLTCTDADGSPFSAATTLIVNPPPSPTLSIKASPFFVALGSQASLNWQSDNTTSCTASGSWNGGEPTSGSLNIAPTTTGYKTYALTCAGLNGRKIRRAAHIWVH